MYIDVFRLISQLSRLFREFSFQAAVDLWSEIIAWISTNVSYNWIKVNLINDKIDNKSLSFVHYSNINGIN